MLSNSWFWHNAWSQMQTISFRGKSQPKLFDRFSAWWKGEGRSNQRHHQNAWSFQAEKSYVQTKHLVADGEQNQKRKIYPSSSRPKREMETRVWRHQKRPWIRELGKFWAVISLLRRSVNAYVLNAAQGSQKNIWREKSKQEQPK